MYIFFGIMGLIFIGLFFFVVTAITGFHIETSKGSHVGYITSVETTGIFFKTNTAYVKTDTQSSQEDAYCVIDEKVMEDLKSLSEKHVRVEINYFDWLQAGIRYCDMEKGGIINSVREIN